jgi:hypothetical protein
MNDKQYKKLMRWFTIAWFSLLVLIVVMIYTSYQGSTREMRNYVNQQIDPKKLMETIEVPEPVPGVKGEKGEDGTTTIIEKKTVVHEILPGEKGEKGDKGDRGEKGEKGDPGTVIDVRINPVTGDLEKLYVNDDFAEVLVPCERLLIGCGARQ